MVENVRERSKTKKVYHLILLFALMKRILFLEQNRILKNSVFILLSLWGEDKTDLGLFGK